MLISVTLSYDCIKRPRCSFCFLNFEGCISKLKHEKIDFGKYDLCNEITKIEAQSENVTVCFEYNGYGLSKIEYLTSMKREIMQYTMTTMPQTIDNDIICSFLKSIGIEAIALSFDSSKVPFDENTKTYNTENWVEAAHKIKEAGMKLSCNYLIEPKIGLRVPDEVLKLSDQVNLLSFKPFGKLTEGGKENLQAAILYLNTIKPIVVDNCLGVQLGYIKDCRKGQDFVHIYPNGKVMDCCFQEKCYLYKE